jgi:hypothetical protein
MVAKGDLFGLVYKRNGGRTGAIRAANVHSRLLQTRGLETAMPVPSRIGRYSRAGRPGKRPLLRSARRRFPGAR